MLSIPPFCPNNACTYHFEENLPKSSRLPWYHKDGTYPTALHGRVQRYLCTRCGTKFSAQTFSLDYAVKIKVPYRRILDQITSSSGIRSLSRHLRVSDTVILNRLSRLARQSIALHSALRGFCYGTEPFVTDGFESFTLSQYFPNNIHLAVGKDSQYIYGIDYAHLRRKGRMRVEQKSRREEFEHYFSAYKGDITRSFTRMIRQIAEYDKGLKGNHMVIYSDEKREYREVLQSLIDEKRVRHIRIPSTKPRTMTNELFAVNYLDRELRKDSGNHVRETVQFSRDVNNLMDRMWVYAAYHNCIKPFRIGKSSEQKETHAERAGFPKGKIQLLLKTFFTQRAFVRKVWLTESEWYSWYRCYTTPLQMRSPYIPRYAAA